MAVHLQHVRKRYVGPDGSIVPVIDVDEFTVGEAEQVGLIGTSGSGKTTLLHMIAGILVPDEGSIRFTEKDQSPAPAGVQNVGGPVVDYRSAPAASGTDIATLSEAQRDVFRGRHVGYIFQTHHLLPGFTALENVLLGMSFTGRSADPKWARHLLTEVGLADRIDYKPERLSVGQQQRVAVARALANRPSLVLADEPTGALDPKTGQQVLALIRRLCEEVGAGLLMVTHDLEIAKQLQRVVVLADVNNAGKVKA